MAKQGHKGESWGKAETMEDKKTYQKVTSDKYKSLKWVQVNYKEVQSRRPKGPSGKHRSLSTKARTQRKQRENE